MRYLLHALQEFNMAKTSMYPNGTAAESAQDKAAVAKQSIEDMLGQLRNYAREKPDVAMLWCFGIGFVLGWKLKPW